LSCENPSPNVFTSDHSQNTPDVILSLYCGEDTSFFLNPPNLTYFIFENPEGDNSYFLSTPLYDLPDHENADEYLDIYDHGWRDICTYSFNHDVNSHVVNISRPSVFDDLPDDEVETPQAIEALQPKLMVMSSSYCLDISSTSDHKFVKTPQAPHHSPVFIEDQSSLHISHPPPKSHDHIAYAWSKECTYSSSMQNVLQQHGMSAECLSCSFTLLFFVDTFKLRAGWFLLYYLSCVLVYLNIFLVNHAFTNMGQPIC